MKASWIKDFEELLIQGIGKVIILRKIKWTSFRLLFYFLVFMNFLTFGLFAYLIAPFISYLFLNDWRFWKNISFIKKLYPAVNTFVFHWFKNDYNYLRSYIPLSAPPMRSYNNKLFKNRDSWEYGDTCGECADCCAMLNCFFLDKKNMGCLSYNSLFWNYFNCGRFPVNAKHIEYFHCQRFELINKDETEL